MSNDGDLKWAVLIPAYNEALTISPLITEILLYKPTELIVVNDCSIDQTAELLTEFEIIVLQNNSNMGKAASLWKGFDKAIELGMEIVITLDGDAQHDPRDIPRLLNCYKNNQDKIIIAARKRNPDTQPFARFFANKFANFWVSWAAGYRISDSQSGFRIYPVSLLKKLNHTKKAQGFVFESEVLIEAAWRNVYSTAVEIEAIYPEQRRASHFKPYEDILNITKMVAARLGQKNMNLKGLYSIIFNRKNTS